MNCFPLFIDLSGKNVLVIGGGNVALRKIEKLLPFSPRIHVIASRLSDDVLCIPGLIIEQKDYEDDDLLRCQPVLVIAATDDRDCNRRVSAACAAARVPVNVVDDPVLCTFQFPALINHGSLTIGISTGGKSPTVARELKNSIRSHLPDHIDQILDQMNARRETLKQTEPDPKKRGDLLTQYWHELLKQDP